MRKITTISGLYRDIIETWSGITWWQFIIPFFVGLICLAAILSSRESPEQWTDLVLVGVILFVFVLLIFALWLVLKSVLTNVYARAPFLASYLIIAAPNPPCREEGLNFIEVSALKQIAEVEQGAADWRSSFISIFIAGAFVAVFRWAASIVTFSGTVLYIECNPETSSWIMIIALLILFTVLLMILGIYVWKFLIYEPMNRMIMMACIEVLYLMEQFNLNGRDRLDFDERRDLSAYLGYQVILATESDYQGKGMIVNMGGKRCRIIAMDIV